MKTFNKHLKKEHLEMFKSSGVLRVGSLGAYRRIEDLRRDIKEGSKEANIDPDTEIHIREAEVANLFPSNIQIAGDLRIGGSKISTRSQIRDAYVFCVSDRIVQGKFGDSYYAIINHELFGRTVFDGLRTCDPEVYTRYFHQVQYGGYKELILRNQLDVESLIKSDYSLSKTFLEDYFVKPVRFSDEHEYRYVFLTTRRELQQFANVSCDVSTVLNSCRFE